MGNKVEIKANVNEGVVPEWEHKYLCMWPWQHYWAASAWNVGLCIVYAGSSRELW